MRLGRRGPPVVVVDASAVLELLLGSSAGQRLAEQYLQADFALQAPHLIDAEVLSGLGRLTLTGKLEPADAEARLKLYQGLVIRRHAAEQLLERAWQLRANLTAYDALYVALAEGLDVPLITIDGPLARASGHQAQIQLLQ